jgi:hypothetical protein
MRTALLLAVSFIAGCASFDGTAPQFLAGGSSRTFEVPIARVKPAFVSTLSQMGMAISAIEKRGGNEVVKAKKADRSVEIEFERLGPASTRVRVTGNSESAHRVLRETEKRLGSS